MKKYFQAQNTYWLTRLVFLKGLGLTYFLVFFPYLHQYKALVGENGLLPVPKHLSMLADYYSLPFAYWKVPSLFWINSSDSFAMFLGFVGLLCSLAVIFGYCNSVILFILWLLQLSIMHVGQDFWGFGWESNLLETTFLAMFMTPLWSFDLKKVPPSLILILMHRWVLFRLMFGAGLIKLRGDSCWNDWTCLSYHFLTQPIPNPFSTYFHALPDFIHKIMVGANHFVELIIPWMLFFRGKIRFTAGILFALFQFGIMLGGNFAWINFLTLVMIIPCFDDNFWKYFFSKRDLRHWEKIKKFNEFSKQRKGVLAILTLLICYLSIKPIQNLIGPRQIMNRSYDQFHIVNSYGVFGSITKKRYEVILEGTSESRVTAKTKWKEYEFPCKPGALDKTPCFVAPYHYRITWHLWFAAMGNYTHNPWIVNMSYKLLKGEKEVKKLLWYDPFPDKPPVYIRASKYQYFYGENNWYRREYVGEYLPLLKIKDKYFQEYIRRKFGN